MTSQRRHFISHPGVAKYTGGFTANRSSCSLSVLYHRFSWRASRWSAALLIAVSIGSTAAAAPLQGAQQYKTQVEGSTYRVVVRDGVVTVKNKAMLTGRTMRDRDRRRAAVRQATGCDVVDEMWFDATMQGSLQCPTNVALPGKPHSDTKG